MRRDGGGRGGARPAFTQVHAASSFGNFDAKAKPAKKAGKRSAQLDAVEKKMDADENYFWKCVGDVRRPGGGARVPTAQELFARQGASGIDFKQYDSIPVERSGPNSSHVPALNNFKLLANILPPFLHANLTDEDRMGYTVPTPIQKHCVPLSLSGAFDVMACAQTGSGKTVAFLVPLISSIVLEPRREGASPGGMRTPAKPLALVIAPTRELAIQIELEAQKLTFGSKLKTICVYGGAPTREQLHLLAAGVDILVATPGRLNDFLQREVVSLECVRFLCLDEADRMLDMGFEPQIRQICDRYNLPAASNRRTLMFSATFPDNMQKMAQKYMREYVFVAVGRVGSTIESITQKLVKAQRNDKHLKLDLLLPLLAPPPAAKGRGAAGTGAGAGVPKTIVFTQKKRNASWVCNEIKKQLPGVRAEAIHGDKSQSQREAALHLFRDGRIDVLVATDVAARGLDVADVALVVQFDLPVSKEDFDSYVHRIGRTGTSCASFRVCAGSRPHLCAECIKMLVHACIFVTDLTVYIHARTRIPTPPLPPHRPSRKPRHGSGILRARRRRQGRREWRTVGAVAHVVEGSAPGTAPVVHGLQTWWRRGWRRRRSGGPPAAERRARPVTVGIYFRGRKQAAATAAAASEACCV